MMSKEPPTYENVERENEAAVAAAAEHPPPFRRHSSRNTEQIDTLDTDDGGLKSHSHFSDDGRLDIDIEKIDTKLVQQLDATDEEDEEDLPQRTLSKSTVIPGPLNIVIQVVGSRGDVQPFIALGLVLKNKYGHRIRLATHGTFEKFVVENGLEFFDIGGDPAELMAFMVKNPGLIPGMKSLREGDVGKRRKGMAEIIRGCWKSCADSSEADADDKAADGSNKKTTGVDKPKPFVAHAIIANPPSFAHIHCADKLGIPLHLMFTMPWSPTTEFPQPIANIRSSTASGTASNKMSYTIVEMMTWEGLGSVINKFRRETLDLPEISQAGATTAIHRLKIPYTYCWSPALIPKPKDWGAHIDISGFYFLSLGTKYEPAADLAEFLAAGPPPVYIGFGSIVVDDPNAMTKLIFEAIAKTGQRALVSKGWGGLGGDELDKPAGVFMLGNCPHDWLFKHVSCVVHHGGAGTTATGIALGRPTVIVPFFGDQPFWGAMVARGGAGPNPIPYKDLTSDTLADAIREALKPETLERAQELGERIRHEQGAEAGAASFHAQLKLDRIRCMLAPNRPAVWQVKTRGLKTQGAQLSAFAATVLTMQGLLDMNELKLHRPYEYEIDDVLGNPFTGDPNAALGTAGTVANRVARWPVNVGKAIGGIVYQPAKGAIDGGWRGFGRGMGKGLGDFFFPQRGLFLGGYRYGVRALYEVLKKRYGDQKLGFILATHFAQGFEDAHSATEDDRRDVVRRWTELPTDLKPDAAGGKKTKPWMWRKSSNNDDDDDDNDDDDYDHQSTPPTQILPVRPKSDASQQNRASENKLPVTNRSVSAQ